MKNRILLGALLLAGSLLKADDATSPGAVPTFSKDVLSILQRNCQSCHRPGQIGPMPLLTYEEARPWAKAIKSAVTSRKMPPWFADPNVGHFSNARLLDPQEIETLAKWADTGARQGDPKDAPKPVAWAADGWRIKPDVVAKGPQYHVGKSGIIPWLWGVIPSPFKEDTWVTSMEMRPGDNPAVTHHYCIFIVPHREGVEYGKYEPISQTEATGGAPFEGCYEKGQEEFDYRNYKAAHLIPANSDIIFNVHYAPNGQETDDQPQVGFTVTKERPSRQFVFVTMSGGPKIDIPPNEGDYKAPAEEGELAVDAEVVWMQGHAHYRAKEMTFSFYYPDGRNETALRINWNPNWQSLYYPEAPITTPKGTRLHVEGRYDNSANNPFNPDPGARVKFGQLASDEMLFPTFGVLIDGSIDLRRLKVIHPSANAGSDFTIVEKTASSQ
jgi:hypothetical protein